jgi:hypothetical protein
MAGTSFGLPQGLVGGQWSGGVVEVRPDDRELTTGRHE